MVEAIRSLGLPITPAVSEEATPADLIDGVGSPEADRPDVGNGTAKVPGVWNP